MAAKKTTKSDKSELIEALDIIEKEKQISKEVILEAIENSLLAACKNQFGKSENIRVNINRETGEVKVFAIKEVVDDDELEDEATQMGITEAILVHDKTEIGDSVEVEVTPKNFGRIAAQKAKQVVVQKIREEERKVLYVQYLEKEGVQTRMLFGGNMVKQPCFSEMKASGEGYRVVGDLHVTDEIMMKTFWIGVYPGMTDEMSDYMIKKIIEAVNL